MGKVYRLWPLELKSEVDTDEFEQFARRILQQTPQPPGWCFALLKGDRGERAGKYHLLCEIDSLEACDRVAPASDPSEEGQPWYAAAHPLLQQWRQFTTTTFGLEGAFTDFHDITG